MVQLICGLILCGTRLSNIFRGGKQLSLFNVHFKSEKHWQYFPYKQPPFRPQILNVQGEFKISHAQGINIGKLKSG